MIPEFGQFALILALCLALCQVGAGIYGVKRNHAYALRLPKMTAYGQCFFVAVAFFILMYAFLTNDFSVMYVAENSNRALPWFFRACAVWGAHEGSMLLWVLILSIWTMLVAKFSRNLPEIFTARVLTVMGIISIGFLLFVLLTSNPFVRLLPNFPSNGQDLNPILQDPGLIIHPPMLYMGYVGFSVAFAFAMAALWAGKLDAVWARWSRPWTTVAWCFLTAGIVLGSWWSYRQLGWGGWWFWDPVENASFMPWLAGTALIHSLAATEKRDVFKTWTVFLAIAAFSLSLFGTFLVRSGILVSVHAFAVDPKRGAYMLGFLTVVIGVSLGLYAWRAQTIKSYGKYHFQSRETMILINNLLLMAALATVLMGTLYPLVMGALNLAKLSVGPPYFNLVFIPLMIPLIIMMGIAPNLFWRKDDLKKYLWQFAIVLGASFVIAIVWPFIFGEKFSISVTFGLILVFWLMLNTIYQTFSWSPGKKFRWKHLTRSQWAMFMAHIGFSVTAMGILLLTHYSIERNLSIAPGQSAYLHGYQFRFDSVSNLKGPNFHGYKADVSILRNNKVYTVLHPDFRIYNVSDIASPKVAIDMGITRDLYVALDEPLNNNPAQDNWGMRIYYKPFVRWIWAGGWLMVIGGLLAVLDKRYRTSRKAK